ncbi:MAG TPA: aminoglycoside phosphotransferase family protein [Methylomirabilota bacterium]
MPAAVSRAQIADALARALPACGDVAGVEPLLKGHGHQSFVAHTTKADLLLKIALRAEQLGEMKSLRHVLELTARHDIPSPRLLHFSAGTPAFDGRPWLVQEFLDGEDGETAVPRMVAADRAAFFRDFGRAVARLHSVDLGYFAEDFAVAPRQETWTALVDARLERLVDRHRKTAVVPRADVESARKIIRAAARAVKAEVRPSLVHRDLYLPNTLVAAGRFRCLLDFEHARSTDAVSDFVKLRMWVFDVEPGSEGAFCAGYGSNPPETEHGPLRYRVALGLELLSGLLYWKTIGQSAMLADYQRRLREWLRQP